MERDPKMYFVRHFSEFLPLLLFILSNKLLHMVMLTWKCARSKVEGGRMEALKRILPMTIHDFRARMPCAVPTDDTGIRTKPLSLPSTFGHRISRFRAVYQVPSWM